MVEHVFVGPCSLTLPLVPGLAAMLQDIQGFSSPQR